MKKLVINLKTLNLILEIKPYIFVKAYRHKSKRKIIFTSIFVKRTALKEVFSKKLL